MEILLPNASQIDQLIELNKGSADQLRKEMDAVEIALTNRFLIDGPITDEAEQRIWREKIEEKSFGKNTVLYDDLGNPSIMVIQESFTEEDIVDGGRNFPHPAFIVDGKVMPTIYLSKYSNIVVGEGVNARAVSLKGVDPEGRIKLEEAIQVSAAKGTGWHLMTNAEYSARHMQCLKRGFNPHGNNLFGKYNLDHSEKGVPADWYLRGGVEQINRTLTGSGPLTWFDDGTPFGLADLNGGVTEHAAGLRIVGGEIQITENNDAADSATDISESSSDWRAILEDGTLVSPGTEGTLKYDFLDSNMNKIIINDTVNHHTVGSEVNRPFSDIGASIDVPLLLKLLGIAPIEGYTHQGYLYLRNDIGEEKTARRCGGFMDSSSTGISFLALNNPRDLGGIGNVGFRSAFVRI